MHNLQNMYLVRTDAPGTKDPNGPFMPTDLHAMILRLLFKEEKAKRYRARVLRFRFNGGIDRDLCILLAKSAAGWYSLNRWRARLIRQSRRKLAFMERRTKENVLDLFLSLFRSNTTDDLNMTNAPHWTQEDFEFRAHMNERSQRFPTVWLTSTDGLHHIQLMLNEGLINDWNGTQTDIDQLVSMVSIWYYGPQRFNTGALPLNPPLLPRYAVENGSIQEFVDRQHIWPTPLFAIGPGVFAGWEPGEPGEPGNGT